MRLAPIDLPRIDLNADLGEECGDDLAMLNVVTTANIAAGAHAGGGQVLLRTAKEAAARRVNIGAHISYPDREEFGRRSLLNQMDEAELIHCLAEQISSVHLAALMADSPLSHVKAHGALYNDAAKDEQAAQVLLSAVHLASKASGGNPLPVMGMPGSILERVAFLEGIAFIPEAFADRLYANQSALVARATPGAVKTDTEEVVSQALDIALHKRVITAEGRDVPIVARTLCLHGDTPGSVRLAYAVRGALVASRMSVSGEAIKEPE